MRWSKRWAICGLVVMTWPAHADGISGTYVGKGPNSAFLVQLVQTSDGHLTGRYEQVVLQASGKIERMNAAVTGASDASTVVVTIRPTELLSGSITASGTIEGSTLHLAGAGYGTSLTLHLLKSDEESFRAEVANLAEQAQQIVTARAQQETEQRQLKARTDLLAHLEDLASKMTRASGKIDTELPKFPPIEQRYRTITDLMRAALARERSIYGGGQAGVARSQISVAITQATIEADQIHIAVENAQKEFEGQAGPLLRDGVDVSAKCDTHRVDSADLSSACSKLMTSRVTFTNRVDAMRRAFAQVERVWREEHAKQQRIEQASIAVSR
jgi:hypothetical protein